MSWRQRILNPQILPPRLTLGIKVRHLTYTNSAIATSRPEALVITGGRMEHTAIIPDGCIVSNFLQPMNIQHTNIIRLIPLEPHLQIVTVGKQIMKVLQHIRTFSPIQLIDLARKGPYSY